MCHSKYSTGTWLDLYYHYQCFIPSERNPVAVITLGIVAGLILLGTVVFVIVKTHIYSTQKAQTSADSAGMEISEVPMAQVNKETSLEYL